MSDVLEIQVETALIEIVDSGERVDVTEDVVGIVEVAQQGPPGPAATIVSGETPAGAVDGSNATFTAAYDFVPESVVVDINGLAQRRVADFNTSGQRTVILSESPEVGDAVRISYLRG